LPANASARCSAATSPSTNVHGLQYTSYVSDNGAFVQGVSAGTTAYWVGASSPLGHCNTTATVYYRVVLPLSSLVSSPACLSTSSPLYPVIGNYFPMYLVDYAPMGIATATSKPLTVMFAADDWARAFLNGLNLGSRSHRLSSFQREV
jgi:hypothetical protein